jgi:hypothetical protein
MRTSISVLGVLVIIWLLIGAAAAWQRGYFTADEATCATVSSTVSTILVGPLNYIGVNPEIECPEVPEPSE